MSTMVDDGGSLGDCCSSWNGWNTSEKEGVEKSSDCCCKGRVVGNLTWKDLKHPSWAFDSCFWVVEREWNGADETECQVCRLYEERWAKGWELALTIECKNEVVDPKRSSWVEVGMSGVVDVNHHAVNGDNIFKGFKTTSLVASAWTEVRMTINCRDKKNHGFACARPSFYKEVVWLSILRIGAVRFHKLWERGEDFGLDNRHASMVEWSFGDGLKGMVIDSSLQFRKTWWFINWFSNIWSIRHSSSSS